MSSQRIASIELGRVIAILAITALHCQLFLTYFLIDDTPWVGYLFNQATRFAVPLFFLISGYLIAEKLSQSPVRTLYRYVKPLFRIWLIWSVICLLMPFNLEVVVQQGYLAERSGYWNYLWQTPFNSLLEGGLVHLWFLPALAIAMTIIAIMKRLSLGGWIVPVAILLYGYGVLAGSYQPLTEWPAPFFTRNGPFFATLMVSIGVAIRVHQFKLSSYLALALAAIGMALHLVEAFWLTGYGQPFNVHDFLFATPLWATGVFLWLLSQPTLGDNRWIHAWSPRVLAIYVSHLPMAIVMMNVAGFLQLEGAGKDAVVFFGMLALTALLIKTVEGTRLQALLFR
ncbi:acyltransferase [Vibrio sp.]|uniref:acyltransferase n=1 Tax=Vibrio sp. TaxID=678 RepID=UPI003D0DAFEC